ncbi:MAG: 16S rRNA (cytosine(967)-C(5))-methyltransferase RsmB [Deltaproteobacteria bacterium]|nr:16S rRNA (cytosine(967)-C(5))-methyltransferase RsmB [Deltaproteobacteria bacterium]
MPPPDAADGRDPLAARAVALAVLRRVERDRAYADVALDAALANSALDTRDRGLATRLVYGTVAWQGLLDWHLAHLAGRAPETLDLAVRLVLRLGCYQLLVLDRIPAHAAVATSVELAKRVAPAAAGLVNAVLRRAARERATLPLPDAADPVRHLAVAFSHPEWLVARWLELFGVAETRLLLAADNEAAPTVLRARPGERDRLIADLAAQGIVAEPSRYAPDAVEIDAVAPHALAGYGLGAFTVQSEASQLVALLLDPQPGTRVLDVCAAPGGKATYVAELVGSRGLVVAFDRRRRGAAAIATGARRLGIMRLAVGTADARRLPLAVHERFDRILVDAPCSGLGTLRAHPEVRWSRGPADVLRLAALQAEILHAATAHLAPGGALVYATCTLSAAENEGVVEPWLAAHPELERDHAAAHLAPAAAALVDASGALRTLPHRHRLDGFYALRVRRR